VSVPFLARTATQVQTLAMTLVPHGGQGVARRNAWAAMSADAGVARSRREADLAMAHAQERSRRAELATS
jgi:hypothetical protein